MALARFTIWDRDELLEIAAPEDFDSIGGVGALRCVHAVTVSAAGYVVKRFYRTIYVRSNRIL